MKREIYIDGRRIEYELTRKKVKNLNLRVNAGGVVSISADNKVPVKFIENFITANSAKILEFVDKINEHNANDPSNFTYENGSRAIFLGKEYKVRLYSSKDTKVCLNENYFDVFAENPDNLAERLNVVAKWFEENIMRIYSEINTATSENFKKFSVPKAKFSVKRMVSRWGSCKVSGNKITINSRLIYYPYECIEAVFVHEYAHFLHYNHDKAFYDLVISVMPSYKTWDRILKEGAWG